MEQKDTHIVENGVESADSKQTPESGSKRDQRRTNFKQICCIELFAVIVFALGITGGILIGIYVYHDGTKSDIDGVSCQMNNNPQTGDNMQTTKTPDVKTTTSRHDEPGECPTRNPVQDEQYENYIFSPLTTNEMNKAATYLLTQNLISTLEAPTDLTQNFILYQFLQPPRKADALEYLDKEGPKPKRYSKVTVQRGGASSPDVMEYKVGPLDSNIMTVESLIEPGYIHFNSRPYESLEMAAMNKLLLPDIDILAPLISESFDEAKFVDDLYIDFFNGPPSTSGTDRVTRCVYVSRCRKCYILDKAPHSL